MTGTSVCILCLLRSGDRFSGRTESKVGLLSLGTGMRVKPTLMYRYYYSDQLRMSNFPCCTHRHPQSSSLRVHRRKSNSSVVCRWSFFLGGCVFDLSLSLPLGPHVAPWFRPASTGRVVLSYVDGSGGIDTTTSTLPPSACENARLRSTTPFVQPGLGLG